MAEISDYMNEPSYPDPYSYSDWRENERDLNPAPAAATVPSSQAPSPTQNPTDAVNAIAAKYGLDQSDTVADAANLAAKNPAGSVNGANDYTDYLAALDRQYAVRAVNEPGQEGDWTTAQPKSGTTYSARNIPGEARPVGAGGLANYWNSSSAPRTPRVNVPGQFTDPIASYLEQFAQTRAQDLENPPFGSGQNLYEDALRAIAGQYAAGGYTTAQQELLNTQAIEPIEMLRQERRKQVQQQLSQRGIDPNSGVGRQMLQDVDRQFDQAIIAQRRLLANQATTEQQSRQMQSVNLLNNLAGTERGRLDSAYNYRTVPLNLADRAFSQASGLYNQTGNPLSVVSGLAQLASSQQAQQSGLSEVLGYLANVLASGG